MTILIIIIIIIIIIAFDEVEHKPNFDLWLSRGGCSVHGYMLKKSTFL